MEWVGVLDQSRRLSVTAMLVVMLASACTTLSNPSSLTEGNQSTVTSLGTTTTALVPPVVDVGVDLESGTHQIVALEWDSPTTDDRPRTR